MSQKVAIVLDLDDATQSYHLEQHLRNNMFPNKVISYANLPDTEGWYKTDPVFKKLVDNCTRAKKERDNYIFR